jgi:hypothetical protein
MRPSELYIYLITKDQLDLKLNILPLVIIRLLQEQ